MGEWWTHLRRGPAGPALVACAAVVAVAVRFAPAEEPASPTFYRTTGASLPGDALVNVPIGRLEHASAHHLLVREGVRRHLHRRHDETVLFLAGQGILDVGGRRLPVEPGLVVQVPRGVPHSLAVTGDPVEAVSVFSPAFDGVDRVVLHD